FLSSSCDHRDLHSFPTRRSSDLQPEFDLEPPVALARDATGDDRLRIDRLPVGKARQCVEARDLLDKGGGIDRREQAGTPQIPREDRKSTRLNSSHLVISYAVFCL